jgi:hypothetical protein
MLSWRMDGLWRHYGRSGPLLLAPKTISMLFWSALASQRFYEGEYVEREIVDEGNLGDMKRFCIDRHNG